MSKIDSNMSSQEGFSKVSLNCEEWANAKLIKNVEK